MTPADFIAKWGPGGPAHSLSERAGAQPHFIDLCRLLGVPEPGAVPGEDYVFEQHTLLLGEAREYKRGTDPDADVAIEKIGAVRKLLQQSAHELVPFQQSSDALRKLFG